MPAKNSQPLTEAKFNAVIRALQKDPKSLEAIAAKHGLKPSTIRTIRQAKTWEEYERRKALKVEQQNGRRKMPTEGMAANMAAMHMTSGGDTAQGSRSASKIGVPKRGVRDIDPNPIPSAPLTREELRNEVRAAVELLTLNFEARMDRIEAKAEEAYVWADKFRRLDEYNRDRREISDAIDQARKERKPFWRFW